MISTSCDHHSRLTRLSTTYIDIEIQTDRQTDRQTETETDTETERERRETCVSIQDRQTHDFSSVCRKLTNPRHTANPTHDTWVKGNGKGRYSSSWEPHLRATGRHLPYGITQCYLPPDTSEHTPPNPSRAGWYSIYLPRRDGRLS